MGGAAAIIKGTVEPRLLEPQAAKRSLLDRLLGRTKLVGPSEVAIGDGRAMIDLPAGEFGGLATDFVDFLHRSIQEPWDSTNLFFDYLTIGTLSVYVRGERASAAAQAAWYLQFSFSGCAGMAETSAELGSHWVEKWFQKEGDKIQADYLDGAGFHRESGEGQYAGLVFVPFEGLGYGRRAEGDPLFEFDYSMVEPLEAAGKAEKLTEIDKRFGNLGSDGKCLCQLCSPSFEPPKVEL
jgi:hypothetical protein